MSECLWNDVDENWDIFNDLWNDVRPCIKQLISAGAAGGVDLDVYGQATKRNKKLHRKVVTLIMILRGQTIEQTKTVNLDKYKVTADDIKLLIEEYYKREDKLSVTIDEVTLR